MGGSLVPTVTQTVNYGANRFLGSLPTAYYEQQIFAHLQPCLFHIGETLIGADSDVKSVFFLKSGLISLVMEAEDGVNVEVGLIGFEGVVGAVEALTGMPMVSCAQVQMAGSGWRLPAEIFRRAYKSNGALQDILLRYQHFLMTQAAYSTLCNRRHSIEQRLNRWLLMAHDRIAGDTLDLTHEFIATMLGTRRAAVSIAANHLRQEGLIDYRRGEIMILDRAGLELLSCDCYAAMRCQFDRLLQGSKRDE